MAGENQRALPPGEKVLVIGQMNEKLQSRYSGRVYWLNIWEILSKPKLQSGVTVICVPDRLQSGHMETVKRYAVANKVATFEIFKSIEMLEQQLKFWFGGFEKKGPESELPSNITIGGQCCV